MRVIKCLQAQAQSSEPNILIIIDSSLPKQQVIQSTQLQPTQYLQVPQLQLHLVQNLTPELLPVSQAA